MQQKIIKILKNSRLALIVLFLALIATQMLSVHAFNTLQAAPGQRTELESSIQAKRGIEGIDQRSFARIKDTKERTAVQRSYAALKAVANNASKDREAALMAGFERAIMNLKALPPPKTASFTICDTVYDACKKVCSKTNTCDLCNLGNGSCYLNQWAAAYAKEGGI